MPRQSGLTRVPMRVQPAQHIRAIPDFPGRDAVLEALVRLALALDACLRGSFGGGLHFEGNPVDDANVAEMLRRRHSRPALAPVLDAALSSGGHFANVGANLGLYTLWGARRVGAEGRVHAFEPVPEVCALSRATWSSTASETSSSSRTRLAPSQGRSSYIGSIPARVAPRAT